jgi:archaemetzincin
MQPIFIWWIGEEEVLPEWMEHLRRHLLDAFERPVLRWSSPERPRDSFDARRGQHLSGKVLRFLLDAGPGGGKVLGVTDRDLFIPILTFVFGEAQLGGEAAVVSTARLAEGAEPFGPRLVLERLSKEAVHELGHAFGLVHCGTPGCVMSRSASVRDVDAKSHVLCTACRDRIFELSEGGGDP